MAQVTVNSKGQVFKNCNIVFIQPVVFLSWKINGMEIYIISVYINLYITVLLKANLTITLYNLITYLLWVINIILFYFFLFYIHL